MMLKKAFLIILAILVVASISEYLRVKGLIKISGQLIALSEPYSQTPPKPSLYVLFLGDSTGVGTGASAPNKSLAGLIGAKNPDTQIVNLSKNGLRSEGLLDLAKGQTEKVDLIVVHIGGNDIIHFKDLNQTVKNIKAALNELSPQATQIAVFTTGNLGEAKFFPAISRPFYAKRAVYLRGQMLKMVGDYSNVYYVDLFNRAESLGQVGGYAADKLHLNDNGYELWYKALKDTLPAHSKVKF